MTFMATPLPRTLEVVKNLSKPEAMVFFKMSKYIFDGNIIVNSDDIPLGGEYNDILILQDAGIIGQISNHWQKGIAIPGMSGKYVFMPILGHNFALIASADKVSFRCHILTTAGKQLLTALQFQRSLEDIKVIAKEISRQNGAILIKMFDYIPGQALTLPINKTPLWTSID